MKSHISKQLLTSISVDKDSSTLKSDIHLGLATSVNYHYFGQINPNVYLIEVNNCILLLSILIILSSEI